MNAQSTKGYQTVNNRLTNGQRTVNERLTNIIPKAHLINAQLSDRKVRDSKTVRVKAAVIDSIIR